mgnify:CR=1 FL=1
MKSKFPYGISSSSSFGIIPTIFLWLNVKSPSELIPFSFLFDTGADVTSFPASAAEKLGIDLDKCPQEPMSGYEGTTILVYKSKIKIRFNQKAFEIPCVFHPNEEVPILLGRAGIIDKFDVMLDGKHKAITFEEI